MKTNEPYSKRPDICYKDVGSTLFIGAVTPLRPLRGQLPSRGAFLSCTVQSLPSRGGAAAGGGEVAASLYPAQNGFPQRSSSSFFVCVSARS